MNQLTITIATDGQLLEVHEKWSDDEWKPTLTQCGGQIEIKECGKSPITISLSDLCLYLKRLVDAGGSF